MKINIILISTLVLLLQGCSSTPEKDYYFSERDFIAGNLSIPDASDDEIDSDTLESLNNQVKLKYWTNLALFSFNTLNPQDLTYYYLGVAAEGKKLYKSSLKYYNQAILHSNKGETCKGVMYDDCNGLDFPSEILKSIDRIKHKNRDRSVTINIDKPNSFFVIDGTRYKSGRPVKLKPGEYNVQYYSDALFSETVITLTSEGSSSESIELKLKDNSKDSFSLNYVEEMNEIGKTQVNQLKGLTEDFSGIGIRFSIENNIVKIMSVLSNGPADKANLKEGDIIKRVNGKALDASNTNNISKLLKGSPSSKVTISINRNGNVFDVDLVRNTIKNFLTMNDFDDLISWRKDVIKQLDVVTPIFSKLDRNTSLYKATNEQIVIFNLIKGLLEEHLLNIDTVSFSEYAKLANNLKNTGIESYKIPLYNNARLKGTELYATEDINSLNCKAYVLATKNLELNTNLVHSEQFRHSSKYIKEYREVPNDRYSQIKSELREARYALEDYRYEQSVSDSNYGGSGGLAFLSGVLGGMREDQLEEDVATLQSKLRNTSRTIREEITATYYPIKSNVSFSKNNSVEWMSINCKTGRVNTYKIIKEDNRDFTLYEGVRSDDLNNLISSNQSTKSSMKQWSNQGLMSLEDIESNVDNFLTSTEVISVSPKSIKNKVIEFLQKK